MAEVKILAPHDPLPEGHSIVVMHRFDEDAPRQTMIELIVTNPDRSEETARAAHPDGSAMTLDEAVVLAQARAKEEGLDEIWQVDRTGGRLEQEVLRHGGDHSFAGTALDDDDLEEGERGPDMRDRGNDGGPRRF
jgi:hypothetical protein